MSSLCTLLYFLTLYVEQAIELRNKCDAVEKTEAEKRQLSEKKHQEELQALRKTNQQLKVGTVYYNITAL